MLALANLYNIRNFQDGDETKLIELFQKSYKNFAGYTPRTPEYWRWCCLERPDVEKSSILIVSIKEKIVGYAVVGKSGNLWELVYDPDEDGKAILRLLFDRTIDYLNNLGVSSVSFNAPLNDQAVKQLCQAYGFACVPAPRMFLSVLNLKKLVTELLKEKRGKFKFNEELVLIKISDAPFWIEKTLQIRLNDEQVRIIEEPQKPSIQIETDYLTLSSLLFGNVSPIKALVNFKLKIKPFNKSLVAIRLFSHLRIESEWFFPLSEFG